MRGDDPFWGFDSVRAVMGRGGRGPTWGLLVLGALLIAVGAAFGGTLLVAIGVIVVLVGAWPLVGGLRNWRIAAGLTEHAQREDAILAAARQIVTNAVGASAGRGSLATLVAADPSAADAARRECLRNAAAVSGQERDSWLDAANEIGRLRAPEEVSG